MLFSVIFCIQKKPVAVKKISVRKNPQAAGISQICFENWPIVSLIELVSTQAALPLATHSVRILQENIFLLELHIHLLKTESSRQLPSCCTNSGLKIYLNMKPQESQKMSYTSSGSCSGLRLFSHATKGPTKSRTTVLFKECQFCDGEATRSECLIQKGEDKDQADKPLFCCWIPRHVTKPRSPL
jgi:hypothetical protein